MSPIAIVSGALANKYRNGGEAWVRLSWVMGLRRLGFDVYFVEQISEAACFDGHGGRASFDACANRTYFRDVTRCFGLGDRSTLICTDKSNTPPLTDGLPWERLLEVASAADLLVNISGHLSLPPLLSRVRRRAYVDIDPGFTQFWHADPSTPFQVRDHDFYFTIGENMGSPDCPIPTGGIPWRAIRQPVVLDDWPVGSVNDRRRFTTVASWRGAFGPVVVGGRTFGLKVHEFRKYLSLPRRIAAGTGRFEIALDIHPGDAADLAALKENGWHVADPRAAAGDPQAFRRYVQASAAEFSVAQGIYVDTHSGWFSDRTVRYLASGRPALVQETGFSRNLPTGLGLVPFRTLDEAIAGAEGIIADYDAHAEAARTVATQHFDSDKVLRGLLREVGVACPSGGFDADAAGPTSAIGRT